MKNVNKKVNPVKPEGVFRSIIECMRGFRKETRMLIIKERTIPIRIQKIKALLRRIPENHWKRAEMEADLAKRWAGFRGEQTLDFPLSKLPEKDFMIFHGLRLSNGRHFFQIDTLLLTTSFALILEVKNYIGTLYFDPILNQLIQTTPNGEVKGYANPIEQARQQQTEMEKWLEKRNISIPIEFLIVISKPSTIIQTAPGYMNTLRKVLHVQFLLNRIEKIESPYKQGMFQPKDLKKVCRILLKQHFPETFDVLKFYNIPQNEILTGALCSNCPSPIALKRHHGTWFCTNCHKKDKVAHIKAINDYFLLTNDSPITNEQLREFLHLSSADIAKKLLTGMKLPHKGTTKGRVYLPASDYQSITEVKR
ncbi:NERD domain-containing protein [Cytobacillus praedii]|uniref:NERD domain-containing protein n=2 Tax=Cytobacillus praedii TaxID=1742358 RepID=A0A4R1B092_9BACI|nr:NERD domain-containing protein [Cytobacillus praedii]